MAELVAQELRKIRVREEAQRLHKAAQEPDAPFDCDSLRGLLQRPTEPPARIEGLMPWEASTLISAQRKTGKTTLTLNLAGSLLTGREFLGKFGVRPIDGTVCVLNFEVSGAQFARWAHEAGVNPDRLFVVNLRGRRNPFTHDGDRARLAALLRNHDVETLIVDPFGRAYGGTDQNNAGEVTKWLTGLDEFTRTEIGARDLILTAHAGWDAERTRGSTALEDWPDAIWRMAHGSKDAGDDGRYFSAMGRDVELDEDQLAYDHATRTLTLADMGSRRHTAADRKVNGLVDEVVSLVLDHPGGINGSEIETKLRAAKVTFQKGGVSKAAALAAERGLIQRVPTGKGKPTIHYPPAPETAEQEGTPPTDTPPGHTYPNLPQTPPWGRSQTYPTPPSSRGGVGSGVLDPPHVGVGQPPDELQDADQTSGAARLFAPNSAATRTAQRSLAADVAALGGNCPDCESFICRCPREATA